MSIKYDFLISNRLENLSKYVKIEKQNPKNFLFRLLQYYQCKSHEQKEKLLKNPPLLRFNSKITKCLLLKIIFERYIPLVRFSFDNMVSTDYELLQNR